MGECARDNDLEVNPVREKKLTNIRTVNADEKVRTPCHCWLPDPSCCKAFAMLAGRPVTSLESVQICRAARMC